MWIFQTFSLLWTLKGSLDEEFPKGPNFQTLQRWKLSPAEAAQLFGRQGHVLAMVEQKPHSSGPASLLFQKSFTGGAQRGSGEYRWSWVLCWRNSHSTRLSPSVLKAERRQLLQLFLVDFVYLPPSEVSSKLSHTLLLSLKFLFMTGGRTCVFLSPVKKSVMGPEGRDA